MVSKEYAKDNPKQFWLLTYKIFSLHNQDVLLGQGQRGFVAENFSSYNLGKYKDPNVHGQKSKRKKKLPRQPIRRPHRSYF